MNNAEEREITWLVSWARILLESGEITEDEYREYVEGGVINDIEGTYGSRQAQFKFPCMALE